MKLHSSFDGSYLPYQVTFINWLIHSPPNNKEHSSIGCFIPLNNKVRSSYPNINSSIDRFKHIHIKIHPYIRLFRTLNINSYIDCFIHQFSIDCSRTSTSRYITEVFTYEVDTTRPSKQMFSGQGNIFVWIQTLQIQYSLPFPPHQL